MARSTSPERKPRNPVVSTRFPAGLVEFLKSQTGQSVSDILQRLLYAEVARLANDE